METVILDFKTNKIMKLIYMEHTLNLIATSDLEVVRRLVTSGTVKRTEVGTYLVIETKSEEQI